MYLLNTSYLSSRFLGNSDSDSEGESSELEKVTDIASRMASRTGDFFFGDGELDLVAYSLDAVSSMDNMEVGIVLFKH